MRISGLAAVACMVSISFGAHATMTTDELIRQLNPRVTGVSRGIRPIDPSPQAAEPYRPAEANRPAEPGRVAPRAALAAHAAPAHVRSTPPPAASTDPQGTASLTVLFETGSDRLTPQAMQTLDTLGRALSHSDLAQYSFNIIGHTDTVGLPDMNRSLSERRASAVSDYIATHYPVDRARLAASGRGQDEPLVPTAPGVNEPRNRRVQVVTVGS